MGYCKQPEKAHKYCLPSNKKTPSPQLFASAETVLLVRLQGLEPWTP